MTSVLLPCCLAILTTAACAAETGLPAPPVPASQAGFLRLTFVDDFTTPGTIDAKGTGAAGYNWYVESPVWGSGITKPAAYAVADSILTVTSTGQTGNWTLASCSPRSGAGHSFMFGYFEARMRFDPTKGAVTIGFPSWWSLSTHHSRVNNTDHWAELDFFEAYTGGKHDYEGAYVGTIHDWADSSRVHFQNSNNWKPLPKSTAFDQWHVYGCRWKPGEVTWYFDSEPLMTQTYAAHALPEPIANGTAKQNPAGVFSMLDREPDGMLLILGSDPEWPLQVDWVRVWQKK